MITNFSHNLKMSTLITNRNIFDQSNEKSQFHCIKFLVEMASIHYKIQKRETYFDIIIDA